MAAIMNIWLSCYKGQTRELPLCYFYCYEVEVHSAYFLFILLILFEPRYYFLFHFTSDLGVILVSFITTKPPRKLLLIFHLIIHSWSRFSECKEITTCRKCNLNIRTQIKIHAKIKHFYEHNSALVWILPVWKCSHEKSCISRWNVIFKQLIEGFKLVN